MPACAHACTHACMQWLSPLTGTRLCGRQACMQWLSRCCNTPRVPAATHFALTSTRSSGPQATLSTSPGFRGSRRSNTSSSPAACPGSRSDTWKMRTAPSWHAAARRSPECEIAMHHTDPPCESVTLHGRSVCSDHSVIAPSSAPLKSRGASSSRRTQHTLRICELEDPVMLPTACHRGAAVRQSWMSPLPRATASISLSGSYAIAVTMCGWYSTKRARCTLTLRRSSAACSRPPPPASTAPAWCLFGPWSCSSFCLTPRSLPPPPPSRGDLSPLPSARPRFAGIRLRKFHVHSPARLLSLEVYDCVNSPRQCCVPPLTASLPTVSERLPGPIGPS